MINATAAGVFVVVSLVVIVAAVLIVRGHTCGDHEETQKLTVQTATLN